MIEYTGRTNIASVVFLDIVGYSKVPDSRQMAMKSLLNEVIGEAVADIAEGERIILDTGDGAALCFLGDPEDALFFATAVLSTVRRITGDAAQQLRIGVNLGAIKAITDLNGRPNVIGDGINVAQRVMDFAAPDEILVSRSYFEVVARLNEGNERFFVSMGTKKDKHVREHQLYAIVPDKIGSLGHRTERGSQPVARPAAPSTARRPATEASDSVVFTEEFLAGEERRLAERIGPIAKIIIRKTAASAKSMAEFYQTIAVVIQDEADRASFLASATADGVSSVSDPATPTKDLSGDESMLPSESNLIAAERNLAEIIGPLASILVKKSAEEATSLQDLYARLAEHITDEAGKRRFLDAARTDK